MNGNNFEEELEHDENNENNKSEGGRASGGVRVVILTTRVKV